MNSEQLTSLLRTVLQFAGGIAVGRGWVDAETSTAIVGALVTIAVTAWSLYTRRAAGIVASAASLPAVTSVSVASPTLARAANASASDGAVITTAR
ncbi:hypothetical protein [Methylobacterium sp.]|uniref:Pam3-gp28 family putative phage holin n=1 Tax=Methylobacterium sp. TaxID=409 RepID=UPI00260035CB|nr:hypothetical protein [Methylobacterium sp.]